MTPLQSAKAFCATRGKTPDRILGEGKDGSVWRMSRATALKIHRVGEVYRRERDCYFRLQDLEMDEPPDWPEEVMEEWHAQLRERFEDRYRDVLNVLAKLEEAAGVHLFDVHADKLKFDPSPPPKQASS